MDNRRGFLGSLVGFLGATQISFGNEIVEQNQSKKLKFLNDCHRVFNCKESELLKYSAFVFGNDFTLPCARLREVKRDLEKLVCVFTVPPLNIKRTVTVQGLGILDPNGIEIVRNNYCSYVSCVSGDTLRNTYTLSA